MHWNNEPVPLKDIARRQNIPLHYLEHLIAPLIAAGIIGSIRGAKGGFQLIKHPQEIKLSEVIQLLEGSVAPVECINNPESCPRYDLCVTRDVWDDMKKAIEGVLESTTLQDLVEKQKQRVQSKNAMYYI
jgi:Rrf2 family protein